MAKKVTVELPDETYEGLLRIAKSREALVREIVAAIEAWLTERKKSEARSILSIVGLAEGDADLSTSVDGPKA